MIRKSLSLFSNPNLIDKEPSKKLIVDKEIPVNKELNSKFSIFSNRDNITIVTKNNTGIIEISK